MHLRANREYNNDETGTHEEAREVKNYQSEAAAWEINAHEEHLNAFRTRQRVIRALFVPLLGGERIILSPHLFAILWALDPAFEIKMSNGCHGYYAGIPIYVDGDA